MDISLFQRKAAINEELRKAREGLTRQKVQVQGPKGSYQAYRWVRAGEQVAAKKPAASTAPVASQSAGDRNHRVFVVHKDSTPVTEHEGLTKEEAKAKFEELKAHPNSEITSWDYDTKNERGAIISRTSHAMHINKTAPQKQAPSSGILQSPKGLPTDRGSSLEDLQSRLAVLEREEDGLDKDRETLENFKSKGDPKAYQSALKDWQAKSDKNTKAIAEVKKLISEKERGAKSDSKTPTTAQLTEHHDKVIAGADLSDKQLEWALSDLANDEDSSDKEMVDHWVKEYKMSEAEAKKLVSTRAYYRMGVNTARALKTKEPEQKLWARLRKPGAGAAPVPKEQK